VREDGRVVDGKERQEKYVYMTQEWKKLLRKARDRSILHMAVERMNE
jgi:hypothetical protein